MSIEAMKQALEALEDAVDHLPKPNSTECRYAAQSLRLAIEQAEKQSAQRQWIGLTDEEINEYDYEHRDFIYDIEALLKHKNTRLG